ncbi:MAG TPA: hypothetical protein VJZ17_03085, partial [Nitrosopumilaceae archaeon]|nr:hypothetical protein [Nitrosopumilaceae archaeon]
MQDPNPLPWGAQDRFQAHFIVKGNTGNNDSDFVAETKLSTKGHFGSKKLVGVQWVGGKIVEMLNNDHELTSMILKQPLKDASIWIDPTKNGIRIYGKWKHSDEFGISKELFAVYDKIASHIRKAL